MNLTSLDKFSQNISSLLFEAYPDWREYAGLNPQDEKTLMVEVPSPVPFGPSLYIYTTDEEITVCFDKWDTHFGWAEQTDEEVFLDAKEFLDLFLSEQLVLAVKMNGQKWLSSSIMTLDKLATTPRDKITYVKSWRGTYK